jgi:hypothetical protein
MTQRRQLQQHGAGYGATWDTIVVRRLTHGPRAALAPPPEKRACGLGTRVCVNRNRVWLRRLNPTFVRQPCGPLPFVDLAKIPVPVTIGRRQFSHGNQGGLCNPN